MWGLLIVFKRMPHLMKFSHSLNANVSPKRIYNFQNTTILIFTQHLPCARHYTGHQGINGKRTTSRPMFEKFIIC